MHTSTYLLIAISLTGIGGCSAWEAPVNPGDTVDVIAVSPNEATYEYTTRFEKIELPYTREEANTACLRRKLHAGRQTIAQTTFKRSRVTYTCE